MERIAVWLLSLPLILGGSEVAHWAAYRVVYPHAGVRRAELAETGHGYLTQAPQAIAVAVAMAVVALAVRVATRRRGETGERSALAPFLPFAALPALAFALQEHLERLLHDGALPLDTATAPTFATGLLLQVPFGLVAFGLARLLLRVADRIARVGRTAPPRAPAPAAAAPAPASVVLVPGASPLALARGLRGPPSLPVVSP